MISVNDTIFYIVFPSLILSFILILLRVIKGPTLADRVIGLDSMGYIAIGFIISYSIYFNSPVLLDIVTVLALVSFLGTAAFAYYIDKGKKNG